MSEIDLAGRIAAHCLTAGLLGPHDHVLVAVSAGADSTALALLLAQGRDHGLPLDLTLGHVDHGWRGEVEADRDRAVVEALAARIAAPLDVQPPPEEAVTSEDAARRFRYGALDLMARRHGCSRVATGHHLRDQAETVLMRVLRGSGPVGLTGIPARRSLGAAGLEVVRPLLDTDPRELRTWLEATGVAWREDRTNADLSRDRARVRRRLLDLEARGGSASRGLAEVARRLGVRLALLGSRIAAGLEITPHARAAAVEVPRSHLAALAPSHLDLALRDLGRAIGADRDGPWFTRRHLARIATLLGTGGALDLPRGLRFEASGRRAWLRRLAPPAPRIALVRQDAPAGEASLDFATRRDRPDTARLDADVLGEAATIRLVRLGDRFRPSGREPDREVDVLAWLKRRQVPRWLRLVAPVVVGANGVAWVVGYRVDRSHVVTRATRRIAHVTCPD